MSYHFMALKMSLIPSNSVNVIFIIVSVTTSSEKSRFENPSANQALQPRIKILIPENMNVNLQRLPGAVFLFVFSY